MPVLFGAALHEEEIACFVVDLSQNKQTQEKLNHLAYHDALTDLPNQVLFKDRLKQAIALSRRNDQMQAVLLLNLDRFKTINDSLGYTAGDRLLQSVAQRLTSCVRESDTVARFGGDEFAILLTQIPRAGRSECRARDQAGARSGVYLRRPGNLRVEQYRYQSLSARRTRHGGTVEDRGRRTRSREGSGRQQSISSTRPAEPRALSNSSCSKATCGQALERSEFVVHYQPQVDIRGFHLVGMEALVRWQHPSLGLLYPKDLCRWRKKVA